MKSRQLVLGCRRILYVSLAVTTLILTTGLQAQIGTRAGFVAPGPEAPTSQRQVAPDDPAPRPVEVPKPQTGKQVPFGNLPSSTSQRSHCCGTWATSRVWRPPAQLH